VKHEIYDENEELAYSGGTDCNADGFPHEIFNGLRKLKEIPCLFSYAQNYKDATVGTGSNITHRPLYIDLLEYNGESMFKDCVSLKNISALFSHMDTAIVCRLTGKAFKRCELTCVSYAFGYIKIQGEIPFGLFYQSTRETWDDEATYECENPTIENMANVLIAIHNSTEATPYTAVAEDLVMDNPNYSMSAEAGTKNSYKKIWNLYAYDGTKRVDFEPKMQQAINTYGNLLYSQEHVFDDYLDFADANWSIDPVYFKAYASAITGYDNISDADISKYIAGNYFCAPDIFKYCVNATATTIDQALRHVNHRYCGGDIRGAYGRIPEMLFYPISNITKLEAVLYNNSCLFPHSWGRYDMIESAYVQGVLYPEDLFKGMNRLRSIPGLFGGTLIWPKTRVPENLFSPISSTLQDINNLWDTAIWVETGTTASDVQVPDSLFTGCTSLTNVGGMFGNSNYSSVTQISEFLFTAQRNPYISVCSGFLRGAYRTSGRVPRFWDFTNLPPQNNQNVPNVIAAFDMNRTNITNIGDLYAKYPVAEANPYIRSN
jgi:hypothetical protein